MTYRVHDTKPSKSYKRARLRPQIAGLYADRKSGKLSPDMWKSFYRQCIEAGITREEFKHACNRTE